MANPELDQLLNTLVEFAQQQLAKRGGFVPFGGTVSINGQEACVGAYDESVKDVESLKELLTESFRRDATAGKIRAAGLCYDGRTIPPGKSEKTDAIIVQLEHREGQAATLFLPYNKSWLGKITYGELFQGSRQRQFFV